MAKPNPKAPSEALVLTKEYVAQSQLETAIALWFEHADPVSILTLAAAANDCYDALGAHVGKPSMHQSWLRKQSKGYQISARIAQNFVKHGRKNLKAALHYSPQQGDWLIMDSIVCHAVVFSEEQLTPLMRAYYLRFVLEYTPDHIPGELADLLEGQIAEKLLDLDRRQFFQELTQD